MVNEGLLTELFTVFSYSLGYKCVQLYIFRCYITFLKLPIRPVCMSYYRNDGVLERAHKYKPSDLNSSQHYCQSYSQRRRVNQHVLPSRNSVIQIQLENVVIISPPTHKTCFVLLFDQKLNGLGISDVSSVLLE